VVSSSIFFFLLFSLPNLSGSRVDAHRTSTHGVALVQLAGNTGRKNDAKIAISGPSHNFVGLYLRN